MWSKLKINSIFSLHHIFHHVSHAEYWCAYSQVHNQLLMLGNAQIIDVYGPKAEMLNFAK